MEVNEALNQYEKIMWRYTFNLKAEAPNIDMDDAMQEFRMTVMRAVAHFDFKLKVSFNTYVHASLRNKKKDLLKAAYRRPVIISLDKDVESGYELTYRDENGDILEHEICDQLSSIEKLVLQKLKEGYTQKEIGKQVGSYKFKKALGRIRQLTMQYNSSI